MSTLAAEPAPDFARFAAVTEWIFDLDNTLYPPHADVWPKIDQRITAYIADLFGVDGLTARALQKYYYRKDGTSLNGLMREVGIDPHAFLDFVHDIDRTNLPPDPALAAGIAALPGRKFIFTNGSRGHALATLEPLGLSGLFDGVFDIVDAAFTPKPALAPYAQMLREHGIAPHRAAMFEDLPQNLARAAELGLATVLVVAPRHHFKEAWEHQGAAGQVYDAVTDNLGAFVGALAAQRQPRG